MEVFHFSRFTTNFNSFPLDIGPLGRPYLGFIFDKKLTFHQHVHFYFSKALSTVKDMKILGNLLRELLHLQKWLLYQTCIMPIALYGFQLWYFKEAPTFYLLKELRKIQYKTILWIIGIYQTSLS